MAASGVQPARDPPIRVETLHESERCRVTRLFLPARTVVRKEPLGADWEYRLRHELGILQRLRGVAGVAQLADAPSYLGSIMLEDVDGLSLAHRPVPLEQDELVRLSLDLARAVAGMHHKGVVHRDISPANVLLSESRRIPCLVDFALATSFAEVRPEFTHHNEIVGTLAYLAPEQTGRTGRPVDQRADLYALGATLYELGTGAPPFGVGDPLTLIHDHLARVPVPPTQVNPAVPAELSDIVMHLLEKEPDNRYQTADGLIHDLTTIRTDRTGRAAVPLRVGDHDFPPRLLPPSRLVGRDAEIGALGAAFASATSGGRHCGLLVSGAPGVGKTSLIDELRPIVTASDGYFVAGKYDQYRSGQEDDGILQAFRGLGRLLLAEPEDQLAELRERIMRSLGPNAGLVAAVVPEFAVLLNVPPDLGDISTAQVRAQHSAVVTLRAIASRKRPVVFVVDDLQWAASPSIGYFEPIMSEPDVDGLLVVGAYRDDVDATHPLTAMLSRWQRQEGGPEHLRLGNLPPPSLARMVADMLRLDAGAAADLARAIAPYTKGNPYDTVELVNALRHHGILVPTAGGWGWDAPALACYLYRANVPDLVSERPDALPAPTRAALEAMACLGGRTELSLLQAATGHSATMVEQLIAPVLDAGLLVMEPGDHEAVRFRHDRLREVILLGLNPVRRNALTLGMARRLAAVPELCTAAAVQYLPVIDAVRDVDERRTVAGLLRRATDQAKELTNHVMVEKLSAAAVRLTDRADTSTLIELHIRRHAALYNLARLDEADEIYRTIDRLATNPLERVDATVVQVSSLTNRVLHREAIRLGVDLLRQLGVAVPAPDQLAAEIDHRLEWLYRWLDQTSEAEDLGRPAITDPLLQAAAALIDRVMPAAYFADQAMMAWLSLEALRIWAEHGPGRALIGPASYVGFVTIAHRQDYRTGYQTLRRILTVGKARAYEPDTSQALFFYAIGTAWFEPLEDGVRRGQQARDGLVQGGDLANASYTYFVTAALLLDCAPSLDSAVEEVEAGLAFVRRTGDKQTSEALGLSRWLVRVLRGEGEESAADLASPERYGYSPQATVNAHITRALAAAIFGDAAELSRHTTAAMPLLPAIVGRYWTALAYLLRALALASEARGAPEDERGAFLAELDAIIEWLSLRAADAPVNFLHLLRLVQAERAWAAGDFQAAAVAFDAAGCEAAARQRPWHRALTVERAARFYLAHGMEQAGHLLLAEARQVYLAWGATAKVDQIDWAYPTLQASADTWYGADQPEASPARRRSSIMPGTVDMLGVLAASQALSSETSIDGLRTHVEEVLGAMTGATGVQLIVRSDNGSWLLSTSGGVDDATPVSEAGKPPLVPLSAVRYAERIREPLVVADAARDDRFARDPYFAGIDCCSLLVVPIMNRGELEALLLLENRLIRSAFSTERLEGIMLIAGQLAVSLDNAMVYASLERKVAERTRELGQAKERLELLSITDPLTGLANRRRLEEVLNAEWHRGRRSRLPVALAMIDIDHFKLYNDHYGHAAGDHCLQRVAAELRQNTRTTELVARYGGEEFAVVMPDTDVAAALRSAEQLRTAIATLAVPHMLATERIVTVSIGVGAMVPLQNTVAESLVDVADVELYRAKRSGRNRVRAARTNAAR